MVLATSSNAEENEMVVTPWEVRGKVDYERLIVEFGTQPLTKELLRRIVKHTNQMHMQLQRRLFFSQRDLDTFVDLYEDVLGQVAGILRISNVGICNPVDS